MPEDLQDSVTGNTELVFPDDATSIGTFELQERSVYDAEEVRVEIEADIPRYGKWIPVTIDESGAEAWLSAPSELRSILVDDSIKPTERFKIQRMEKRGSGDQSDPYQVQVSYPDRDGTEPTQKGLADS